MLSRRTILKYTGISGFWGLMAAAGISMPRRPKDGGSEQLPTNIAGQNPWDSRNSHITPEHRYWRSTDESLPKDGEVVLLATSAGGSNIWLARFVARRGPTEHWWSFITLENQNDLYPGLLGDYKWMPLPSNPFDVSREWDYRLLADPLADYEQVGPGHYRVKKQ